MPRIISALCMEIKRKNVFLKEVCHGDFSFLVKTASNQNQVPLSYTKYLQNTKRKISSEFSKTGVKLKIQSISILAICSLRHLFLLLEHLSLILNKTGPLFLGFHRCKFKNWFMIHECSPNFPSASITR